MKQELRLKISITMPIEADDAFQLAERLSGIRHKFDDLGLTPIMEGAIWKMDAKLVRPRGEREEAELPIEEAAADGLDIPAQFQRTA